MATRSIEDLVRRLEIAETELRSTRAEVRALQSRGGPMHPLRRWPRANALVAAALLIALGRTAVPSAQDSITSHEVRAPFVVVGASGRPIMTVTDCVNSSELDPLKRAQEVRQGGCVPGLELQNAAGESVVNLHTLGDAGSLQVTSGKGDGTGFFASAEDAAMSLVDKTKKVLFRADRDDAEVGSAKGVVVFNSISVRDKTRTAVKLSSSGLPGVTVYNPQGNVAAQMTMDGTGGWIGVRDGVSKMGRASFISQGDGDGMVEALSRDGITQARMIAFGGQAVVLVTDSSGSERAQINSTGTFRTFAVKGQVLSELGSSQAADYGRLWLGNMAGEPMVEAGMLTDGRGTVRAGPGIGGPPSGLVLPALIVGHLGR
jgi:hypothetical protein